MYILEDEATIDIKEELKRIAEKLGFSYIEKNSVVNVNGTHSGSIQVGSVLIKVVYRSYIQEITAVINNNSIERMVIDYMAGMTDDYILREYQTNIICNN